MASFKLLLLPGDGIGPEVMAEVEKVIACFNAQAASPDSRSRRAWSAAAPTTRTARRSARPTWRAPGADAVLFGAVGGPKWDGVPYDVRPEAGLLRLRKDLALFANLRPAICYPGARRRLVAQARGRRGPRHHDRARTDRRRLFRRAQGDHRSRQRPEARHRHAGLRHLRDRAHRPRRLRSRAQARATRSPRPKSAMS